MSVRGDSSDSRAAAAADIEEGIVYPHRLSYRHQRPATRGFGGVEGPGHKRLCRLSARGNAAGDDSISKQANWCERKEHSEPYLAPGIKPSC